MTHAIDVMTLIDVHPLSLQGQLTHVRSPYMVH